MGDMSEFEDLEIPVLVTWRFIWKLIRKRKMAVHIRCRVPEQDRLDVSRIYVDA